MAQGTVNTPASTDDSVSPIAMAVARVLVAALAGWLARALFDWTWGVAVSAFIVVLPFLVRRWVYSDQAIPVLPGPLTSSDASAPRNHIICLDGTWNSVAPPASNVRKLFLDVVKEPGQIARYYSGVGTRDFTSRVSSEFVRQVFSRNPLAALTATGRFGATSILHRAYFDFVKMYRPGDRIFIFGFSRGATTARALANFICETAGLPGRVDIQFMRSRIEADPVTRFDIIEPLKAVPDVEFLGLFDTVAKTGNPFNDNELSDFDLSIPPGVKRVCHLVAI